MGREFELKFRADEGQLSAIEARFPGFSPISMETTYYDNPRGDLGKLHWTLRHRLENGRSVCTLKTPGENNSCGEWEVECDAIHLAIPVLCKLGAPEDLASLTSEGLTRVCGARFTRMAARITLPECTLELALDRGAVLGGNAQAPISEVEVELKSGSEEAARAFAQALAQEFGLTAEHGSKFKRALALARG